MCSHTARTLVVDTQCKGRVSRSGEGDCSVALQAPFLKEREDREVLAIIPARGGSKGLVDKNVRELCGKPLIAYSIEAALKSPNVTRVVVSTDNERIAEVAREWGAEVPYMRPQSLASDTASLADVSKHMLDTLKAQGYHPFAHILLLPTSPFRNPRLIGRAVEKLREGYSRVITVRPVSFAPQEYYCHVEGQPLTPLFDGETSHPAQTVFKPYGLLYAYTGSQQCSLGTHVIHLDDAADAPCLIDIDTQRDLALAQDAIRREQYNFDLI